MKWDNWTQSWVPEDTVLPAEEENSMRYMDEGGEVIVDPYLANPALANAEMRERTQDWNRGFPQRNAEEQAEHNAGPPYPGMIWGNVGQGPMGTVFGWRWPPGSIFGPQPKFGPLIAPDPNMISYPNIDKDLRPVGLDKGTRGQPLVLGEPSTIKGDITGTDYAKLAEGGAPEALTVTPLNRPEMGGQVPQMPGVQAPQMGQMDQRMIDMEMMRMMVANTMASLKMPRRVSKQALA